VGGDAGGGSGGGSAADRLAVFASGRLIDTDVPVGALGYEPADAGQQLGDGRIVSGWSAFTGDETDEELTDAERVRLPSLAVLLERDPAIAQVTATHDGTVGYWIRRTDGDEVGWERLVP
jgi:hypothetical protein